MDGGAKRFENNFTPIDFPPLFLRENSNGLFDTIFEECEAGIFILDLDISRLELRIADVNSTLSSWLGYSCERLKNEDFFWTLDADLNPPDVVCRLRRACLCHSKASVPVHLKCKNAGPLQCALSLRPIKGPETSPRMVAIIRREDAAIHQAFKQVQYERDAAMQARERVLSRMSHDLRTPLNGILGFAELLVQRPEIDEERLKSYASDIAVAGEELLARIEDMLCSAENLEYELLEAKEPVKLHELVHRTAQTYQNDLYKHAIALRFHLETGLPTPLVVERELSEAIAAIMKNAVLALKAGDTVRLGCAINENGLPCIFYEDDGPALQSVDVNVILGESLGPENVYSSPHSRVLAGLPKALMLLRRNGAKLEIGAATRDRGLRVEASFPL